MPDPVPERLLAILRSAAGGGLPPEIAFMQLAMEARSPAELSAALASGDVAESPQQAARLAAVAAIATEHPEGWQTVKSVLAAVSHLPPAANSESERVADIAAMFDRASAVSPEASVALYSLGDPARLAAATGEIVSWLGAKGLVGPAARVLDVGCGIGRMESALSPYVASVLGLDVSAEMVALARRRCAGLANVEIALTSGLDLAELAGGTFTLVLYVDCFPYLVSAGDELARRHVEDAARVLAPAGSLIILNHSYRGDLSRDRSELLARGAGTGLTLHAAGERPFAHWDGAVFHLIKSG